jgi:hypothetical protein
MEQVWHRIERRGSRGQILDFVEVGACTACGRGVDRSCPNEYRIIAGRLYCSACAATSGPQHSARGKAIDADDILRELMGEV